MGILIPPSVSGGLNPRGMMDLGIWGALDLLSRCRLGVVGVSSVLSRGDGSAGRSYATSSSLLSSLPRVPIHTPTPTGIRPLRLPVENVQSLLRRPLRQA